MNKSNNPATIKTRRQLRIIALGDCNSNTTNAEQGTVPSACAELFEDSGFQVDLTNLAHGMDSTREGLAHLVECNAAADIAVINYGLVDAWITSLPRFYVSYHPNGFVRKRIRKLVKFTKRFLARLPKHGWVPRGPVVPEQEFRQNIEQMMELIRESNPAAVFYLWGTVDVIDAPERNENLLRYNRILQQIAACNNAVYVDSSQALNGLSKAERHLDSVHLSPAAARLIGNQIYQHYLSQCNRISDAA